MTFRPRSLVAWSLSYLLLIAGWSVVFTTCEHRASRYFGILMFVVPSAIIAAGAVATSIDEGAEDEDVSRWSAYGHGFSSWFMVAALPVAIAVAAPIGVVFVLPGALYAVVAALRGDDDSPYRGIGWGLVCGVAGLGIALAWAWLLEPVAGDIFGGFLSGAEPRLREASLPLIAAALPLAICWAWCTPPRTGRPTARRQASAA